MKVLYCKWNSICENDTSEAMIKLGFEVTELVRKIKDVDYEQQYMEILVQYLQRQKYDCVFSINYIPIISRVCQIFKIKYISWTVDSPLFQLYSKTIDNNCNEIFIFDKMLYEQFKDKNPGHIHYMPLGTNVDFWDKTIIDKDDLKKFSSDVSFIGSLYSEKCNYNKIRKLPPYLKGYIEGIIESQLKVYGYNFIEEVLTEEIIADIKKNVAWKPLGEDYHEDDRGIVAHELIGVKCSEVERIRLLDMLSQLFEVDFYTLSDVTMLKNINNKGPADSRLQMPKIFKLSKINLNITARTIRSGLSLRVFDIMGCGGFLLTNYQTEIPEYFEIGRDLEVFESENDLKEKVRYYLENADVRKQIAKNGYEKVKKYHTYEKRFEEIFKIAFK